MTPHGREIRDEVKRLVPEWLKSDQPLHISITSYCIRLRNLAFMDGHPVPLRDHMNRECRRSFWNGVIFASSALLIIALGLCFARR